MIDLVEKERVEGFLLSLTEKQEEYLKEKQALETEKAKLILYINWDEFLTIMYRKSVTNKIWKYC